MKHLALIAISYLSIQGIAFADISSTAFKKEMSDVDTLKSSLSANHAMIKRFESEYDLISKQKNPSSDTLKKLPILKNKITLLKRDNGCFLYRLSRLDDAPESFPQDYSALTGKDWIVMGQEKRELYLFSAMGALIKKEVITMEPLQFYIQKINDCLAHSSACEEKKVDDILLLVIYKFEPDSREPLNSIRKIAAKDLKILDF